MFFVIVCGGKVDPGLDRECGDSLLGFWTSQLCYFLFFSNRKNLFVINTHYYSPRSTVFL